MGNDYLFIYLLTYSFLYLFNDELNTFLLKVI